MIDGGIMGGTCAPMHQIDTITFMVGRLMFTQSVYVSDKNEDFIKSFIIIVKFSIAYRIKY